MGKFSRLLQAKGKDVEIDGEVFNIKPLGGKYMGLFLGMDNSDEKKTKAIYELVLISLQQTDESITAEDINELPLKYIMDIFQAIMEVNEFKE